MRSNFNYDKDENNLREFLMCLWFHKVFIFVVSIIALFICVMYGLGQTKLYSAKAIFSVNGEDRSNNNTKITAALGINTVRPEPLKVIGEQISSRIFIDQVGLLLDFKSDPFFNSYNPNYKDPEWKRLIKEVINFPKNKVNHNENIWQGIISTYNDNLYFRITEANNIVLSFTHTDPNRASDIVNTIMTHIIQSIEIETDNERSEKLKYLSNTLATALDKLERSQSILKEFSITKATNPFEAFEMATAKLTNVTTTYDQATILYNATKALLEVLKNKTPNLQDYNILKNQHPIIDDVEFRRIFGQNAIIREWSWPDIETVMTVFETLEDRRSDLLFNINQATKVSEDAVKNVQEYEKLLREVNVAEATYTVLLEHVKADSIMAGYKPDFSKVYEYSSPPTVSSYPNYKIYAILGLIFGLFTSSILSIIFAVRKGSFYSISTIISNRSISYIENSKFLKKYKNIKILKIEAIYNKMNSTPLRKLIVEIIASKKNIILISDLYSLNRGFDLAKLLGVTLQNNNSKVAYIDFSLSETQKISDDNFSIIDEYKNLKILSPSKFDRSIDFFTQKNALTKLNMLKEDYDTILICCKTNDAQILAQVLNMDSTYHIALMRKGKTKLTYYDKIHDLLPVEAIIYE